MVRIISPSDMPCDCSFPGAICIETDIDTLPPCTDGFIYRIIDPNCGRPFLVFCWNGKYWPVAGDGDAQTTTVVFATDGTPSDPNFIPFASGLYEEIQIPFNTVRFDDCGRAALTNGIAILEDGRYRGWFSGRIFTGSVLDEQKDLKLQFGIFRQFPSIDNFARHYMEVTRTWSIPGPNLEVGAVIPEVNLLAGDLINMTVSHDTYLGDTCGLTRAEMGLYRVHRCQVNCDEI